jgi:REP element-mobilizing transposase RayT
MANTYTSLHYHIVFSTKGRLRTIERVIEERVWSYLGGVARENRMTALCIGGIEDHIHILLIAPPTITVSKAVQLLKGTSSKWIHETFPRLRRFAWQDGYGAFTVSQSSLPAVIRYIQQQRAHHATQSFQDEFLQLLEKHRVKYDERYLWD